MITARPSRFAADTSRSRHATCRTTPGNRTQRQRRGVQKQPLDANSGHPPGYGSPRIRATAPPARANEFRSGAKDATATALPACADNADLGSHPSPPSRADCIRIVRPGIIRGDPAEGLGRSVASAVKCYCLMVRSGVASGHKIVPVAARADPRYSIILLPTRRPSGTPPSYAIRRTESEVAAGHLAINEIATC
jgi:hypothetical protein